MSLMFSGALNVDSGGIIVLNLQAGSGLSQDSTGLTADHDLLPNYVANEHIDWTAATANFLTTGNVTIDSDTSGLILGDGQDATLKWDNAESWVTLDTPLSLGANGIVTDIFSSSTDNAKFIDASGDPWILAAEFQSDIFVSDFFRSLTGYATPVQIDASGDPWILNAGFQAVNINLTDETAIIELDGSTIFHVPTTKSLFLGISAGPSCTGDNNIGIGYNAGFSIVAGIHNTFLGAYAGYGTTGSYNFGLGSSACRGATGNYNTYVGTQAGQSPLGNTGSVNTGVGPNAAFNIQGTATSNVCIGSGAGKNVSGDRNTCIGQGAGYLPNPLSGSYNTFIGSNCTPGAAGGAIASSIAIGASCTPTASHQGIFGSASAIGYVDDVYIGYGVVAVSPGDVTVQVAGGSGTNNAAGDFIIAGGKSTGNATPGVIIFKTTSAGASGTTPQTLAEVLRIGTALVTLADAVDIAFNTTTGTKLGTAVGQKIGFWNATPVVQQAHIVDADGTLADITTKFNTLLAQLEAIGLLASA